MKSILLLLLLAPISALSQCVMIKIDLKDCISCRTLLSHCNPQITNLPAYAIFPSSKREDSSELEYVGKFSKFGLRLMFNDVWFSRIDSNSSSTTIVGIDKFAKVIFKAPLHQFKPEHFQLFVDKNRPTNHDDAADVSRLRDSINYSFNYELGTLTISNRYSEKIYTKLKSADISLQDISRALDGKARWFLEKYGEEINRSSTHTVAKFTSFTVQPDGSLALLYHYSVPAPLNTDTVIIDRKCIVLFDSNWCQKSILPLNHPDSIVPYTGHFLYGDSLCYLYCYNINLGTSTQRLGEDAKYIYEFRMTERGYDLTRLLPYTWPTRNKEKYGFSYLGPNFSEYPFVYNYLSDSIFNLKSGRRMSCLQSIGLSSSYNDTANNVDEEYFQARPLRTNKLTSQIFTPFKVGTQTKLNTYDFDFNLLYSIDIETNFIEATRGSWVNIHPEVNLIQIRLERDNLLTYWLPLDLFSIQ